MSSTMTELIDHMTSFGFTEHEARVYLSLCESGDATGYQVAKNIALPRANVYASLERLVKKGAVLLAAGQVDRYRAISPEKLVAALKHKTTRALDFIAAHAPWQTPPGHNFYNLSGREAVIAAALGLVDGAQRQLVIDAWSEDMQSLAPSLVSAHRRGVRVIAINIGGDEPDLPHTFVHPSLEGVEGKERNLTMLVDASTALVAELGGHHECGLISRNSGLVRVVEEALMHDLLTLYAQEAIPVAQWEQLTRQVDELLGGLNHAGPRLS